MKISTYYNIVEALQPDWPIISDDEKKKAINEAIIFIAAQVNQAPLHLKFGIKSIHLFFTLLLKTKNIHYRKKMIAHLAKIFPPFKMYVRLMRSLMLLHFMEYEPVRKKINEEIP